MRYIVYENNFKGGDFEHSYRLLRVSLRPPNVYQMFVFLIEKYGNITVDGEEYTDTSEFEDNSEDVSSNESDGEIQGHHSEVVNHIGPMHQPQIHSESSGESDEEDSGMVSNGYVSVNAPKASTSSSVDKKFNQMKISQPQVKEYYRIAFCSEYA